MIHLDRNEWNDDFPDESFDMCRRYVDNSDTRSLLSSFFKISEDYIRIGNGAVDISEQILSKMSSVFLPCRTQFIFRDVLDRHHVPYIDFDILRDEDRSFHIETDVIIKHSSEVELTVLVLPSSPDGSTLSLSEVERICQKTDRLVLIDITYMCFSDIFYPISKLIETYNNVAFLWSASKFFGICGARIGVIITKNKRLLSCIVEPLLGINSYGYFLIKRGIYFLKEIQSIQENIIIRRDLIIDKIALLKRFIAFESNTNFFLLKSVNNEIDMSTLFQYLLDLCDIKTRYFGKTSQWSQFLRISVGNDDEMIKLFSILRSIDNGEIQLSTWNK